MKMWTSIMAQIGNRGNVGKGVFLLILFTSATAQPNLIRYEDSRISMACTYSIVAYGEDEKILKQSVNEAFDEVDRIDRLMSHYKKDSPLSKINREAAQHPVKVDRELWEFLIDCRNLSVLTDGAFDITVGPLMKAWGFFRGEGRMPTAKELLQAQKSVGYQHMRFDIPNQTIQFDREGVELDLGGIAKGYAVDQAVAILKSHQIQRALISAGGSTLYALGAPPDKDAWEVHLQDPLDARKIARTMQLRDEALSVSGSAEKFFELNGKRYSHIMNPRTGYPVMNMLSVAVVTRHGLTGDALDNAFYVMGAVKARRLLKRFSRAEETEILMFVPEKSHWKMIHITPS
jgi:FAD:protein FMN transferase